MDLFKDDPVRPNLNPKFRLTENRVNFLLTQDFTKPCAIICVAFTKDIPKTFSYGNFLLNNPNANRIERRKAVKEFLDATRK